MISYKDELQHSGTKGMRWGIRKYRNYDGTLTPAGKERYDYSDGSKKSGGSAKKVSRRETRAEKKINKAKEAKKEAKAAAKEAKQAAAELKKEREAYEAAKISEAKVSQRDRIDMQKLSNEELKAQIDRLNLERQYASIVNPPTPEGKSKLQNAKEFLGTVAGTVGSIKSIAESVSAINKLRKGNPEDVNKALKLKEETERLKASIDKSKYDTEVRNRKRAEWATDDAKTTKRDTPEWANPSSNYNFKSQQHAASEWTKESRIFGLPSGSSETKSRSDHGSVWASRSGLLGLPAPSSGSNSSSSEPRVVGYYDPDGKFHRT